MSKRIRRKQSWARYRNTPPQTATSNNTEQENNMTQDEQKDTQDNPPRPYLGGPRSSQGREKSSQNAAKHSLCATTVHFLNDDERHLYTEIEATWLESYLPRDAAEKRLLKQLVDADFHLERAAKTLAEVEAQVYNCGYLPGNWSDDTHFKLARITRYHTTRHNAAIRARKALEDYRRNRTNETRGNEKHAIYKEKYQAKKDIARYKVESILKVENAMRQQKDQHSPPDKK